MKVVVTVSGQVQPALTPEAARVFATALVNQAKRMEADNGTLHGDSRSGDLHAGNAGVVNHGTDAARSERRAVLAGGTAR
jgi:hypothetical protein